MKSYLVVWTVESSEGPDVDWFKVFEGNDAQEKAELYYNKVMKGSLDAYLTEIIKEK